MQRTPEVTEKIKKNIIIHYYEYVDAHREIDERIRELNEEILELYKQKDTRIEILLPASFANQLVNEKNNLRIPNFVEWTTNYKDATGAERQKRELVYIEKISYDANYTGILDRDGNFIMDISNEYYCKLDGYSYGRKSIIRLSGREGKIED